MFTAAQAEAEGWTARQIRRRISTGRWVYVAGSGLAAALPDGANWSDLQLAAAAQLTVPGSTTSHWTAGALHGFPLTEPGFGMPMDAPPRAGQRFRNGKRMAHVISDGRHDRCAGIVIHRLRLDENEVAFQNGWLRITDPQRTAVDLLATLPTSQGLDLWAWISTRRILDRAGLEAALDRRRQWYGSANLVTLLRLTRSGAVSGAEFLLHALLRKGHVSGWTAGARVCDEQGVIGTVDVFFRAQRVIVEVDGFRAHSSQTSFIADRRRQNRLIAAGYVVLRYTWSDLTTRATQVIQEIKAVLAR